MTLVLTLAMVVTTFAIPTAARASAPSGPVIPKLVWTACGNGSECASARLPLDYDDPRGDTVSIKLARLPATDPAHRIGSIFVNPGGPGASGVDLVRFAGPVLFTKDVRARFDLVGFDPRGILRSSPLRCFTSGDAAAQAIAPLAFPTAPAEEQVWERFDRKLADACARRAGPVIDHMSTANAARDLDVLRQAVGDDQLTYAGYSYGSYLGATYANMFPTKVRALVVDGVLDPVAWATGRGDEAHRLPFSTREESADGANATLAQFFELCDRGGPNCAFSGGDPAARYDALLQDLRDHPLQLPRGLVVTYADVVNLALGALYSTSDWPALADALDKIDRRGNPVDTANAIRRLRARLAAPSGYPNYVEGAPGVFCSDSDNPSQPSAWATAARASARQFGPFAQLWTWYSSICAVWPGQDRDRFSGPFTHHTANPVLIVGNRYDPATRYQGAVTLSQLLPESRLLTLDGWGHTSVFQSACVDRSVARYLLTQSLPKEGTVCEPNSVPFAGAVVAPLPAAARLIQRG